MDRQEWLTMLGVKLGDVIKKYHYSGLESGFVTKAECKQFRSMIYGLPSDDKALRKFIIQKMKQGRIEEITEEPQYMIFHVKVRVKNEWYRMDLRLESMRWSLDGLQYVGKVGQQIKKWAAGIIVATAFILAAFLLLQHVFPQGQSAQNSPVLVSEQQENDREQENNQPLSFSPEDLRLLAEEHNMIVMTTEEYNSEAQQASDAAAEQALAEYEQEMTESMQADIDEAVQQALEQAVSEAVEEAIEEYRRQNEPTQSDIQPAARNIFIQSGMASSEVARLFQNQGFISDHNELQQVLTDLNLRNRIRSGNHTIPANSSVREIAEIITGS